MDSRDGVEQLDIELEKDRALSHSTLSFPCLAIHNISTRPKGGGFCFGIIDSKSYKGYEGKSSSGEDLSNSIRL